MEQGYPKRKRNRLEGYDYTQPNYYYVTVCAKDKKSLFGEISHCRGVHCMPPAPVGEIALVLALGDAVKIALRLGVADEIDGGHGSPSWNTALIFHSIPHLADFGKGPGGFFCSGGANWRRTVKG